MAPVMDFQVRELLEMDMPLAIDFGTTNTTARIYLDSSYIERLDGGSESRIPCGKMKQIM